MTNIIRRILDWFDPPKCELCKDSGWLHHLNARGQFEHRPCRHCDIYQGEIG